LEVGEQKDRKMRNENRWRGPVTITHSQEPPKESKEKTIERSGRRELEKHPRELSSHPAGKKI